MLALRASNRKSDQVENMFKNNLFIATLFCLLASCSTLKPGASRSSSSSATETTTSSSGKGNVQFISNISINSDKTHSSISPVGNKPKTAPYADRSVGSTIENYPALQFKYAILENASVEELDNPKLLSFMDYWYGTPYHYGGTTRDGIDCSAFAFLLMSSVYSATLPRTSKEQYETTHHIHRDELQEGDLVFFHTLGKRNTVTHVGVYLRNNKFVHASVSGVMISDMNDGYYDKHFVGAGRILDQGQGSQSQGGPGHNQPSGGQSFTGLSGGM